MAGSSHTSIAYLVNQYPKISHSFIRREIQAIEEQGFEVLRLAMRGWDGKLVDAADIDERSRTRYLLKGGVLPLLLALCGTLLLRPVKFLRALQLATRMSRRSDRPLSVHVAYLAEACAVLWRLRSTAVRHVHAHFGTNAAEIATLLRALGGPTYSFTVHGPEEFDKPEGLHLATKVQNASFVVAISSFGASQVRRWVKHAEWPKIRVVRCGVDEGFLGYDGLPRPDGNRLVCVGRLCEQKGQLLLVMAAAELARRGQDFTLVLAGDGDMRAEIESLVDRYNLTARVRITGWLSSEGVREEILASRALVLPSFAEGLPVVIMEAMALRCPVVSTFVAGIPELVIPGETGWLVPAGDVAQLVDAIQAVLQMPETEIAAMGRRGRQRVAALHSATREARRLAEYFREVTGQAG